MRNTALGAAILALLGGALYFGNVTTPASQPQEIPAKARATAKGQEIAKLRAIPRTTRSEFDIEIVSMNAIDGGVEVFARAWKDGEQIGFGRDGSVEIERFRIFNPPTKVPDPNGPIRRTSVNQITGQPMQKIPLREDPREAVLQVIEQNIKVIPTHGPENIVAGKIGNTTSTFYPDASPESTSVDGYVRSNSGGANTFLTDHDSISSTGSNDTQNELYVIARPSENPIWRSFALFDTSSIPDTDTIDSATISLQADTSYGNANSAEIVIVDSFPASNTAIAAGDMDAFDLHQDTVYSRVELSAITLDVYTDFTLDSNGIANISKTGVSKFGMRVSLDADLDAGHTGTIPTNSNGVHFESADNGGTTMDPKLVVVHSAAAAGGTTDFGDVIFFD